MFVSTIGMSPMKCERQPGGNESGPDWQPILVFPNCWTTSFGRNTTVHCDPVFKQGRKGGGSIVVGYQDRCEKSIETLCNLLCFVYIAAVVNYLQDCSGWGPRGGGSAVWPVLRFFGWFGSCSSFSLILWSSIDSGVLVSLLPCRNNGGSPVLRRVRWSLASLEFIRRHDFWEACLHRGTK